MKNILLSVLGLLVILFLYWLAYGSSNTVAPAHGSPAKLDLEVLGIRTPFTPGAAKVWDIVFYPPRRMDAAFRPAFIVHGKLKDIGRPSVAIDIEDNSGDIYAFVVDPSLEETLLHLRYGQKVVAFGYETIADNSDCVCLRPTSFHLKEIKPE